MTSPFETLGLLPSLVRKLNERQLKEVAKAAAKGLQIVYHPDKQGKGSSEGVSYLINEAVRNLTNETDIQSFREAYLADGPGQREIQEAENKLLELEYRIIALKDNLAKTKGASKVSSKLGDVWLQSIFSDYMGMDYVDGVGLHLRHSVNMSIDYASVKTLEKIDDVKTELAMLAKESQEARSEEATEIKELKDAVEDLEKTYARVSKSVPKLSQEDTSLIEVMLDGTEGTASITEKDLEKLRADTWKTLHTEKGKLASMIRKQDKRAKKIQGLNNKIKKLKATVQSGRIDETGHLILGSKKTGLRVAGVHNFAEMPKGRLIADSDMVEDFLPFLEKGAKLVAADKEGRIHEIGVLQNFGKYEELRQSFEIKVKEPEEKQEKSLPAETSADTSLARPKEVSVSYEKNPFEVLGILPHIVRTLSPDDLRAYLSGLSKALKRVTHPDFIDGGSPGLFNEMEQASTLLGDAQAFGRFYSEYASSKPGEARLKAVELLQEKAGKEIATLFSELAKEKLKASRFKKEAEEETTRFNFFIRTMLEGIYLDALCPKEHPDSPYLWKASGSRVSILSGQGTQEYVIEAKGFDVYAICSGDAAVRLRLLGSTIPGKFPSMEDAMKNVRSTIWFGSTSSPFIASIPSVLHPLLHAGSFLVAAENREPRMLGRIEKIDARAGTKKHEEDPDLQEAKRVGRRMAERSKGPGKGAIPDRKPKTLK